MASSYKRPLLKILALPLAFLAAVMLSGTIYYLFLTVSDLGKNIPQINDSVDYFTASLWGIGFGVLLIFSPTPVKETRALLLLWLARCGVTLAFMLIYEYLYLLDAYQYFLASLETYFETSTIYFGNGTAITRWFSWLLNKYLPVNDSYHALKVIYSFIGLIGTYTFYRAFSLYWGKRDIRILYLLGLFPSILFWSSILGKDPIVFFGISIYTYGVLGLLKTHRIPYLFPMLMGIALAAAIRVWTAPILIAPIAFAFIFSGKASKGKRIFYSAITLGIFGFSAQILIEYFGIVSAESLVATSSAISGSWSRGGSGQEVEGFSNIWDMLAFAPKGMFAALFRPLPFEVGSLFGIIAGFENFVSISLLFFAIKRYKWQSRRDSAMAWGISLILTWSFVYGFASYQNLGSASRFKLQVLPILMTILFYMVTQGNNKNKS